MRLLTLVAATLTLGSAACSKDVPKTGPAQPTTAAPAALAPVTAPPAPASKTAADEATEAFSTICASCHGGDGTGNGPAAAALNPKPRNYTDAAWQAAITDDLIAQTIVKGGAAMGKSPLMPAHPQFESKPEVVAELVKKIRAFKK